MSTSNAGKSTAGKTLGGLIVLLINIVGFGGIGYAVGGVTGAIWVTLIGLVLFGLLFAWPSLTSGAEQTGLAKIVSAPFALVASIILFIPALIVGLVRRLKAQRDRKMGIEPTIDDVDDTGEKRSFFYGRWTDATTLSLFLVNAVVALIIAVIFFGPVALIAFGVIATPVFLIALFLVGLNGANPELAKPQPGEEVEELAI
ncbi:MAG: hypothetical protein AAF234_01940 [Pseudomonadota bacterium]